MNSKQESLYIYNIRNQSTSSFEENYDKKICFIFIPLLITISYLNFNRSNKTDETDDVPT